MLTVYRRHLASCKHRSRRYRHCQCPLWTAGTLSGKKLRRSLDLRNWEEAQTLIRTWEVEGNADVPGLQEAADRLIADMKARGLAKETIAKYELLREELVTVFGSVPVVLITPDDAARFRERWEGRPSIIEKKLERLKSFFKFCLDRDWICKNPARGLKPPKEISIEKKPFEKDELEKIEWAIPLFPIKGIYGEMNRERIRAFTLVIRWTGLRIRDAITLRRSMVRGDHIILRAQKNGKIVKILVRSDVLEALEKVQNPGDYYFWSGLGNPKSCVGDWQRTFRRLSTISGVHIHAHRWRHTFATDLLSKGVPVSEVAALLGNSIRVVEKHYAQWIEARQIALDAAVRATWE